MVKENQENKSEAQKGKKIFKMIALCQMYYNNKCK